MVTKKKNIKKLDVKRSFLRNNIFVFFVKVGETKDINKIHILN